MSRKAYAPHCDPAVLHAPGDCTFCDHFPEWQEYRKVARINFTGQNMHGRSPCPSTYWRSVTVTEMWPGNRAHLTNPGHAPEPTPYA